MLLIYGSGLLFAALVLLCVARSVFDRLDTTDDEPSFGPTEAVGLGVTALLALGLSYFAQMLAADQGAATITEIAGALAAVAFAGAFVWRLTVGRGRAGPRSSVPEAPEGRPAHRGPGPSGRPGKAPGRKRAA